VLFRGAVASLDPRHRAMLGHRVPAVGERATIHATGGVLDGIGAVLGKRPGTERAALRRIDRLRESGTEAA
jgi:hypothetical protein